MKKVYGTDGFRRRGGYRGRVRRFLGFTLSRDNNTGAVTVRYDSPKGCPITFNWTSTIDVDGFTSSTPIQVVNRPTP
ncbi:MAG: hypothetical protein J5985_03855 [Kiritimatiellae bacterium]|nr:hypothetical protein [Kiritimatiellia bacterium]